MVDERRRSREIKPPGLQVVRVGLWVTAFRGAWRVAAGILGSRVFVFCPEPRGEGESVKKGQVNCSRPERKRQYPKGLVGRRGGREDEERKGERAKEEKKKKGGASDVVRRAIVFCLGAGLRRRMDSLQSTLAPGTGTGPGTGQK